MRAVSLFAGIGGFDLAMERAGIKVVASAEIDPACRKILARHFPHAYQFDDVRSVTAEAFQFIRPGVDIVAAGWPCQGNSVAGLRKGMADPRSGLWTEVARILAELRPRWFVGENVPGLLSVNKGRDFEHVITSLAELGYGVAWRVLDAQYTGVPQRRRRVLIVGCLGDPGRAAEVLFDAEGSYGDSPPRGSKGSCTAGTSVVSTLQGGGRRGYRVDAESAAGGHLIPVAANCLTSHPGRQDATVETFVPVAIPYTVHSANSGVKGRHAFETNVARCLDTTGGFASNQGGTVVCVTGDVTHTLTSEGADASEDGTGRGTPIVNLWRGVRRLMPIECERLQGFPDGWTEWHGGTGKKQSDSARYRQLGNAVAVPVVRWVMDRIVAADRIDERMAA